MSYRNAPIHPVLRFIYLLLRIISWLGISVFYRRRIILGREHLKFDGPAIIVVNHPSTLMDVLNPCVHIRQESFFLANYGLFKHPLSNWILRRLFSIPVKRREDVAEGELRNNDAAFEQSFEHVEKNGLLFIAAEGVSWMDRCMRPFKTGAARIVFGSEKRNNWQLGVKVLPIGVSYSAPDLFRSEVIVHFGAPISADEWAAAEQENHEKAIEDFTLEIQQQVRDLVLDTRDAAGQVFIEQIEAILRPQFPKSGQAYFDFRKDLIRKVIGNEPLREKTAEYFKALEMANIQEADLQILIAPNAARRAFFDKLMLVLGLPFFLIGYGFWFLPCYLPWLLTKKMNLYIGYASNVKMLSGLFTFPLALWGAFRLVSHFSGSDWYAWLGIILLVLLGYFAENYTDAFSRWRERTAAENLIKRDTALFEKLVTQREKVIEMAG